MLQALRSRDCNDARRLLGAALSLVLVFRLLLGPALLPAPEPGLVPICTGTGLVYMALDGTTEPGVELSDPCPFFGFAATPPEPGMVLSVPRLTVFPGYRLPAVPALPAHGGSSEYAPRAPLPAV